MRRVQFTKEERRDIAKRSEEIFDQDPSLTLEKVGSRLGMSPQHLSKIRKEFKCRPLNEIPGREKRGRKE